MYVIIIIINYISIINIYTLRLLIIIIIFFRLEVQPSNSKQWINKLEWWIMLHLYWQNNYFNHRTCSERIWFISIYIYIIIDSIIWWLRLLNWHILFTFLIIFHIILHFPISSFFFNNLINQQSFQYPKCLKWLRIRLLL